MTSHELAKLILKQPDINLSENYNDFIDPSSWDKLIECIEACEEFKENEESGDDIEPIF